MFASPHALQQYGLCHYVQYSSALDARSYSSTRRSITAHQEQQYHILSNVVRISLKLDRMPPHHISCGYFSNVVRISHKLKQMPPYHVFIFFPTSYRKSQPQTGPDAPVSHFHLIHFVSKENQPQAGSHASVFRPPSVFFAALHRHHHRKEQT